MTMTEPIKEKEHGEEKALEKMTVKELRAVAMEIPHTTSVHDMKKEELIVFIKDAKHIAKEKPVRTVQDSVKLISKQDLKAKFRLLKEEKIEAQAKKDKKKLNFLRYRLNRLKKRTRRAAQA
jgi:hypothetical protein